MARTSKKPDQKDVASASPKKSKRRRPPSVTNESLVAIYLAQLEAGLGDDDRFMPLFEALKADSNIGQAEAVALATRFVARTAEGTPRSKALDRILGRHMALATFNLKRRAMAGRSAA